MPRRGSSRRHPGADRIEPSARARCCDHWGARAVLELGRAGRAGRRRRGRGRDRDVAPPRATTRSPRPATGSASPVVRGSEDDVSEPVPARPPSEHPCDAIVRLTSDCPLLDPALIAQVVALWRADPTVDYVATHAGAQPAPRPRRRAGHDRRAAPGVGRPRPGTTAPTSPPASTPTRATSGSPAIVVSPAANDLRITLDTPEDAALIEAIVAELGDRAAGVARPGGAAAEPPRPRGGQRGHRSRSASRRAEPTVTSLAGRASLVLCDAARPRAWVTSCAARRWPQSSRPRGGRAAAAAPPTPCPRPWTPHGPPGGRSPSAHGIPRRWPTGRGPAGVVSSTAIASTGPG